MSVVFPLRRSSVQPEPCTTLRPPVSFPSPGLNRSPSILRRQWNDRSRVDGETEGFARVHLKKGTDKIVGATIVARHAGEMINEISLAMTAGLGLSAIGRTIHPYPTKAEAIKKLADAYNRTRLTPFIRKVLAAWLKFRRA